MQTHSDIDKNGDEALQHALREALNELDGARLTSLLEGMSSHDALRHISHLPEHEREVLLSVLDSQVAAALIDDAPDLLARQLVEDIAPDKAAEILHELDSATQADLIQQLDHQEADQILSAMETDEADGIRLLASYPADSAGGVMSSAVFLIPSEGTVGSVLSHLATSEEDFEKYSDQHPYAIDPLGRITGELSLSALMTAKRSRRIADLISPARTISAIASLDEVEAEFEQSSFNSLAVVDEDGFPKGVLTRALVAESKLNRSVQDNLSRQQMSEELRSMPTWLRSRRRLAWLSSNIVLNIIAASVISSYEETLTAVIAIAVFLPMVSDMSGCSGNQAVGVSMRELSLGLAKPADFFRVLRKEISVGLINGVVLGMLIASVAWVWKGNPVLGLVIGTALALNTVLAVCLGGTIPLVLKRFGVDPAVASGPLLTTVTDMAGFFFVLSLATVAMPWLVA